MMFAELNKAEAGDVSGIRSLYDQAILYAGGVGKIDWEYPFPRQIVESYQEAGELYCVRDELAEPIAALRLTTAPNLQIWDDDVNALYVGKIAVGVAARNQNVATEIILPGVCQVAQDIGAQEIRGDCLADNPRLKNFYRRFCDERGDEIIDSVTGIRLRITKFSKSI